MLDFKSETTGKRIIINPAPYKTVIALKRVLFQELKNQALGLRLVGVDKTALEKQVDFTGCIDFIKNALLGADISQEVEDAIFECLKYCTYDTTYKITPELFDNIQSAREDYYEIIISCIEENLKPFIKSLVSKWKTLAPKLGEYQILDVLFAQMNN